MNKLEFWIPIVVTNVLSFVIAFVGFSIVDGMNWNHGWIWYFFPLLTFVFTVFMVIVYFLEIRTLKKEHDEKEKKPLTKE